MTTSVETNKQNQPLGWGQTTITWSFATTNDPGNGLRMAPPYGAFVTNTSGYAPWVQAALSVWSSIANVQFQQVPDGPNVDIRIGFGNLLPGSIGDVWYSYHGNTFDPGTVLQVENPQRTPLVDRPDGTEYTGYTTDLRQDLVAQIGYAIGLGSSTDDPNSITYHTLGSSNRLPDVGDILAIQSIYGAPNTQRPIANGPEGGGNGPEGPSGDAGFQLKITPPTLIPPTTTRTPPTTIKSAAGDVQVNLANLDPKIVGDTNLQFINDVRIEDPTDTGYVTAAASHDFNLGTAAFVSPMFQDIDYAHALGLAGMTINPLPPPVLVIDT